MAIVSHKSMVALLATLAALAVCLDGCASLAPQPNPRLEFARAMSIIRRDPTPQGQASAFSWIQRAAKHNLAVAQDRLGLMYLYGDGVRKNPSRGVRWIRSAAERGAPAAQLQLGNLYSAGRCVPRNDESAYYWYALAAKAAISNVRIYNIAEVRAFAHTKARSVAPNLTAARRAALDQRVARWTPTPSVPYSGTALLAESIKLSS